MKAFNQALDTLNRTTTQTGWFESAKYEDGTPVAYVAAVQEWGCDSPPIPPRLGMRGTIERERPRWGKLMEQEIKKMLKGEKTPHEVMSRIGVQAQGDFKKTISKVTDPPLALMTLLLRKKQLDNRKQERREAKPTFVGPTRRIGITGRDVGKAYGAANSIGYISAVYGLAGEGGARAAASFLGARKKNDPWNISGVSTKPLVWSGLLLASLTYLVETK